MSEHAGFRDLPVWQSAMNLAVGIYKVLGVEPEDDKFQFVLQLRNATIAIASNIAQGTECRTTAGYLNRLEVARSSLGEVTTLLDIALLLGYINNELFEGLATGCEEVRLMLNDLMKSLAVSQNTPPPSMN